MEKGKLIEIKTHELFKKTMLDNEYSYDIYFRMAVIDEYLSHNEKIWDLYNKMQYTRVSANKNIPHHMMNHKEEFINLINSIQKIGFDSNFPLLVNNQFMVIDGAHRLSCSMYFNIPIVSVVTNDEYYDFVPNDYSKQWFIDNGLGECIYYAEKIKKKIKVEKECTRVRKF